MQPPCTIDYSVYIFSNIYISWRFAILASDSPIAINREKKLMEKSHDAIVAAAATRCMHNAHNGKSVLSCVLCELNELRIVVRCFFSGLFRHDFLYSLSSSSYLNQLLRLGSRNS